MKICKKCNLEKEESQFSTRGKCKDCEKLRVKEWNEKNREKRLESVLKYNKSHPDIIAKCKKRYYENNKSDSIKVYRRNYIKSRKSKDTLFKITMSIRKMIYKTLLNCGYSKKSKVVSIIGCSFEEFKCHLESKFEPWMTWENKGLYNGEFNYGWDIDHIVPISTAKSEEDIIRLNHFTNLQPLCSKVNRDIKREKV